MLKQIDKSKWLSRRLQQFSEGLARKRGLPVVVGIMLIILSMLLQSINVYAESQSLQLVGVIAHHVGVLIALIGLLLATPLGK